MDPDPEFSDPDNVPIRIQTQKTKFRFWFGHKDPDPKHLFKVAASFTLYMALFNENQ